MNRGVCGVAKELEVAEYRHTQEEPDGRDAEGKAWGKGRELPC